MELALICAQQVIVLFLLIGVGTLAVKTGVLKLEHKQPLSNLLVNIVVPAMIVNSYQMEFSLEILRNLLAAILILLAILTLLIVWGLVNQGLHTAKPAESTPASEPASSLVTEPVNLAPDFVGMDYDSQVRNNHSYAGDYLFYVTMEYSDTVEKGKIIRQTPEAGEVIEKGGTIDLVVSRGPQMVEMPNVAGFTRDGAEQQLAQVGLNASFYPIYNDGSYVSGCVAYCSEEPGAMVEVGSTIIVYMAAEVEAEVPATPPETTTPSAGATPSAGQTEPPADSTDYDTD